MVCFNFSVSFCFTILFSLCPPLCRHSSFYLLRAGHTSLSPYFLLLPSLFVFLKMLTSPLTNFQSSLHRSSKESLCICSAPSFHFFHFTVALFTTRSRLLLLYPFHYSSPSFSFLQDTAQTDLNFLHKLSPLCFSPLTFACHLSFPFSVSPYSLHLLLYLLLSEFLLLLLMSCQYS
jgi:hypothetical protein